MDVILKSDGISVFRFRKGTTLILAFSWIAGLVLGYFFFDAVSDSVASLMVGCVYAPVSIVTLMLAYIFPFLCSALAVFLSSPWLLTVISFGKAMMFSFVFSGLTYAWGTSAASVHRMILACDGITTPFLFCWWLRYISGERRGSIPELCLFLLPAMIVSAVLFVWIIPFWADVLIL